MKKTQERVLLRGLEKLTIVESDAVAQFVSEQAESSYRRGYQQGLASRHPSCAARDLWEWRQADPSLQVDPNTVLEEGFTRATKLARAGERTSLGALLDRVSVMIARLLGGAR